MAGLGSTPGGPLGMKPDSLGHADGVGLGSKTLLNTYIHNYFVDEGLVEIAKIIRQNNRLSFVQDKLIDKTRKGANGTDDSMETDNKDELNNRIDGLPGPNGQGSTGDSFLSTWWGIFWDMWTAARQRDKNDPSAASQYLAHTQVQRARQQQNAQLLQHSASMIQPNFQYRSMMPNTQMNDLQKRAMVNNGRINPAQIQNMRLQQQMAAQNQMQRDGSDMDMNAPRGQSPMPGESAPSPKRARIDSGTFNPNQMGGPNGRVPGMGPQPQNGSAPNATMLINSSFDPMSPAAFNHLNGPPKSAQQVAYSAELLNSQRQQAMGAKNAINAGGMPQGSPMMTAGPEGPMMSADLFPPNATNTMRGGMAGGNGGALADYQMQLMLLEQQNKKRLMMARQEQDVAHRDGTGPPGMMGQPGYAQPMSPQGSRTRHSPNSNDPTKRGADKMNHDSPLPDSNMGGPRVSPAPANFEQGQMPPNMVQGFGMMNGQNNMMVRPPNGHPGNAQMSQQQMEMMRQQPIRMGGTSWPPGMPNQQMLPQGQPSQVDNNQQRNNMPPPPTGRTQPPSPQQSAAPPTPSQANKANPKAKKDNKDTKKKPAKKASTTTGATPSAEAEQSDDVPPPTPSTPKNAASNLIKGPAPPSMNLNMQAQLPASIPPPSGGMSVPPDNMGPFGSLETNDLSAFGDFDDLLGGQDNTDVLHGFDFDAFLHQDPIPGDFGFDASQYLNGDGLETGMGE